MKMILRALLTAGMLSITGTALAATYAVPGDYATIQAAIDSSTAADEIVVSPGTYHEHLVIYNRSVTLRSSGGSAQTIIDGDATGTVVSITAPNDTTVIRNVSLDGFTIQNGATGVYGRGNYNISVKNSVITNNNGGHGVDLYTLRPSSDYIEFSCENTTISNNYSSTSGGGINTYYHAFPTLKNCKIINNTAEIAGGGIYLDSYGQANIESSIISNNLAKSSGGAIYARTYSGVAAVNTVIADNRANSFGSTMFMYDGGTSRFLNCSIIGNKSSNYSNIMTSSGPTYGAPTFIATNSIIWSAYPYNAAPNFADPAKAYIDHSIVQQAGTDPPPFPGVGNLSGYGASQPVFVDYTNGDYRLKFYSPGVDQGVPLTGSWANVNYDILGVTRPKGAAFDMGAYEYVDDVPPVTTAVEFSGRYYGNGWYWLGAFYSLTANDDVALKEIHYTVNGVETVVAVPTNSTGTKQYQIPSIPIYAEGANTFTYYSVDLFGNAETPKTVTFNVAQYRPTISSVVTGTSSGNYYTSDTTITITGQDRYGIKEIHYLVNGVETVVSGNTATVTLSADGEYLVRYFAISNTGIDDATGASQYIRIDKTAPANSSSVTGNLNSNGWYTTDVNVAITATDSNYVGGIYYTLDGAETFVSGGLPTVSTTVSILAEGVHTLSFYSIDTAGNTSATTTLTIKIDKTAPFVTSSSPANNATGVLTSASVVLNLNESVTAGSGFANIVLKKGTTTVTTTKTLSGNKLTIKPSSAMSKNTTYTVTIPANSFVDAAGFSNAAYTLTFKTGTK